MAREARHFVDEAVWKLFHFFVIFTNFNECCNNYSVYRMVLENMFVLFYTSAGDPQKAPPLGTCRNRCDRNVTFLKI